MVRIILYMVGIHFVYPRQVSGTFCVFKVFTFYVLCTTVQSLGVHVKPMPNYHQLKLPRSLQVNSMKMSSPKINPGFSRNTFLFISTDLKTLHRSLYLRKTSTSISIRKVWNVVALFQSYFVFRFAYSLNPQTSEWILGCHFSVSTRQTKPVVGNKPRQKVLKRTRLVCSHSSTGRRTDDL